MNGDAAKKHENHAHVERPLTNQLAGKNHRKNPRNPDIKTIHGHSETGAVKSNLTGGINAADAITKPAQYPAHFFISKNGGQGAFLPQAPRFLVSISDYSTVTLTVERIIHPTVSSTYNKVARSLLSLKTSRVNPVAVAGVRMNVPPESAPI